MYLVGICPVPHALTAHAWDSVPPAFLIMSTALILTSRAAWVSDAFLIPARRDCRSLRAFRMLKGRGVRCWSIA